MSASDDAYRPVSGPLVDSAPAAPLQRSWLPAWALPALVAMALDVGAVAGTAWLVAAARGDTGEALVRVGWVAALIALLLGIRSHVHGRTALLTPPIPVLLMNWGMVALLVCVPAFLMLPLGSLPAGSLVLLGILAPAALLAGREALSLALAFALRRDWLARRSIVVLGRTREDAERLARRLRREPDCRSARPAALFDDEKLDLGAADLVVVQAAGIRREDVATTLEALRALPGAADFVSATPPLQRLSSAADAYGGGAVFSRKRAPLTRAERAAKRVLDVVVAGGALLLLSPLLIALVATLRLRGVSPVWASHDVVGFDGRAIRLRRLASAPGRAAGIATDSDAWAGLREIPGLLSVLSGDLSLVGPAALPARLDERDAAVALYAARQGLKAGLSHASATGRRADDLAYCDQWSLGLDASILARHLTSLCVDPSRAGR